VKTHRTADDFLQDIVEWGERAVRHTEPLTRDQFMSGEKSQDAVSKCISNVGEAANKAVKLDPTIKQQFPDLARLFRRRCSRPLGHGQAIHSKVLRQLPLHQPQHRDQRPPHQRAERARPEPVTTARESRATGLNEGRPCRAHGRPSAVGHLQIFAGGVERTETRRAAPR
jgi:hypothetical protein